MRPVARSLPGSIWTVQGQHCATVFLNNRQRHEENKDSSFEFTGQGFGNIDELIVP
jgi:hypothetical protein